MMRRIFKTESPRRIFAFLVLFRWFCLVPPLIALYFDKNNAISLIVLLSALGSNVLISLFSQQLNRRLQVHPWLLLVDLGLTAVFITFTGGWQSPYYLYALNPLLAAAFFFQVRGAIGAMTAFLPLYLGGVLTAVSLNNQPIEWLNVLTAVVGFYLISSTFGFTAILVQQLRSAQDDLTDTHRDLNVIHDLTVSLQQAPDVEEVQERVLEAVTINLGFKRAVVGLVDQEKNIITGWLGRAKEGQMLSMGGATHLAQIPLTPVGGKVSKALMTRQIIHANDISNTPEQWIHTQFGMDTCRIFPMTLREHPIGVLLVDTTGSQENSARQQSLASIASQAAIAVGTTMMCIDRAQRLAVQDERLRIAQDIHDTVSQSLFGIVYTLDGSLKLLPQHPEEVVPELQRALRVAQETHHEVRQSILNIWPSEITAVHFTDGLKKYVADICQADNLQIKFDINGNFDTLPANVRRGLYRISQEALANTSKHAHANQAQIQLDVTTSQARLTINDNGQGFEPQKALTREYNREHFGLRGMKERAETLGGACQIKSHPTSGTSIQIKIPLKGH